MDDQKILSQIKSLVDEEHNLRESTASDGLSDQEQARLNSLEVSLDQCWDLLRQRRARRSAGLNPEGAEVRDETTVERYLG